MKVCVVGIGSNIDPRNNISESTTMLKTHWPQLKLSSFIETEPIGFTGQSNFLNGAAMFYTDLSQQEVKSILKGIEARLGRIRTPSRNGPRTIDLDILVWGGRIVDDDVFTRDFLQKSIGELYPHICIKDSVDGDTWLTGKSERVPKKRRGIKFYI